MSEVFHDKKRIIAALAQSPHGNLKEYLEVGVEAAQLDPDFFAHLLAWNHVKGSVRDAKVALPIIALKCLDYVVSPTEWSDAKKIFAENALAHIADLRPREFKRAIEFGWDIGAPTRMLKRLTIRYLRDLEANRWAWEATALRHKQPIRWLYAQAQIPVRQSESAIFDRYRTMAKSIDHEGTKNHVTDRGEVPHRFRVFALLPSLSPIEIGAMIDKYKLPFLNVRGALGKKAAEPDVVMALMARMSPSELVTNMKWLKRVGVEKVPALRAMLEKALEKAGKAPKTRSFKISASLKTTKAAEVLEDGEDDVLAGKLRVLQEKQLQHVQEANGVEGDWLVLADKSGSMEKAMATARMVAGTLSRLVKGNVYLVFFDTTPRPYDVTGKTLEEINAITATLTAQGGTSIGVGLQALIERKLVVNGIAIVSDGCENSHRQARHTNNYGPQFAETYPKYVKALGIIEPTVYFYQMETSFPAEILRQYPLFKLEEQARYEIEDFLGSSKFAGIDIQTFDLRKKTVDYHSVAELVSTMRVGRFQLLDEINGVGLRTLDEVLEATTHEHVLPQRQHAMA